MLKMVKIILFLNLKYKFILPNNITYMDELSKNFLLKIGINVEQLDGLVIPREVLIDNVKYELIKQDINNFKKLFSSTSLTSLQSNAEIKQKWPLLNIVRQILNVYNFIMEPLRKSDGYSPQGVKKYKRFFIVKKIK